MMRIYLDYYTRQVIMYLRKTPGKANNLRHPRHLRLKNERGQCETAQLSQLLLPTFIQNQWQIQQPIHLPLFLANQ